LRDFEDRLERATVRLQFEASQRSLTGEEQRRLEGWLKKAKGLQSAKARDKYSQALANKANLADRKVQRVTSLSLEEEARRLKTGWQCFDMALYLGGCASQEEVAGLVADGAAWVADRQKGVLLFSDQVPVWLQVEAGRVLARKEDLKQAKTVSKLKRDNRQQRMGQLEDAKGSKQPELSSLSPLEEAEEQRQQAQQQRTQVRGAGGNDRWRVSLVCRQAVLHFFDSQQVPRGPSFLLVVCVVCVGVWCVWCVLVLCLCVCVSVWCVSLCLCLCVCGCPCVSVCVGCVCAVCVSVCCVCVCLCVCVCV
jgi:hypothetical protein